MMTINKSSSVGIPPSPSRASPRKASLSHSSSTFSTSYGSTAASSLLPTPHSLSPHQSYTTSIPSHSPSAGYSKPTQYPPSFELPPIPPHSSQQATSTVHPYNQPPSHSYSHSHSNSWSHPSALIAHPGVGTGGPSSTSARSFHTHTPYSPYRPGEYGRTERKQAASDRTKIERKLLDDPGHTGGVANGKQEWDTKDRLLVPPLGSNRDAAGDKGGSSPLAPAFEAKMVLRNGASVDLISWLRKNFHHIPPPHSVLTPSISLIGIRALLLERFPRVPELAELSKTVLAAFPHSNWDYPYPGGPGSNAASGSYGHATSDRPERPGPAEPPTIRGLVWHGKDVADDSDEDEEQEEEQALPPAAPISLTKSMGEKERAKLPQIVTRAQAQTLGYGHTMLGDPNGTALANGLIASTQGQTQEQNGRSKANGNGNGAQAEGAAGSRSPTQTALVSPTSSSAKRRPPDTPARSVLEEFAELASLAEKTPMSKAKSLPGELGTGQGGDGQGQADEFLGNTTTSGLALANLCGSGDVRMDHFDHAPGDHDALSGSYDPARLGGQGLLPRGHKRRYSESPEILRRRERTRIQSENEQVAGGEGIQRGQRGRRAMETPTPDGLEGLLAAAEAVEGSPIGTVLGHKRRRTIGGPLPEISRSADFGSGSGSMARSGMALNGKRKHRTKKDPSGRLGEGYRFGIGSTLGEKVWEGQIPLNDTAEGQQARLHRGRPFELDLAMSMEIDERASDDPTGSSGVRMTGAGSSGTGTTEGEVDAVSAYTYPAAGRAGSDSALGLGIGMGRGAQETASSSSNGSGLSAISHHLAPFGYGPPGMFPSAAAGMDMGVERGVPIFDPERGHYVLSLPDGSLPPLNHRPGTASTSVSLSASVSASSSASPRPVSAYSTLPSLSSLPSAGPRTARKPNELPTIGDAPGIDCKPPHPYHEMIRHAIEEAPEGRLQLSQIYTSIAERFPFFKTLDEKKTAGWQNSIRHNLSLKKMFVRVNRVDGEPDDSQGKGGWWTVQPGVPDEGRPGRKGRGKRGKGGGGSTGSKKGEKGDKGEKEGSASLQGDVEAGDEEGEEEEREGLLSLKEGALENVREVEGEA